LTGGLNYAGNQPKMGTNISTSLHKGFVQRNARCLLSSASIDFLLVGCDADGSFWAEEIDKAFPICTVFDYRMLGLGEHQVTKKIDRIEKSIGIAIVAYLILIRARKGDIKPGKSWSIFPLKNNFTMHLIQNQFQHSLEIKMKKLRKAA